MARLRSLTGSAASPIPLGDKVVVRLDRLRELGHELRRPEADFLRDGIYELRTASRGVNYRVLYFFHSWETCRGCRTRDC